MSLSKDLLDLLENKDEPLAKRLKLADNAFKSVELPLQRKEAHLLKWLSKITKADDDTSWTLLLNWLRSPQVHSLNRSDITHEELQYLLNVITKRYKHEERVPIITDCVLEIVQNKTFQLFFKHDLLEYCKFVTGAILKIKCPVQLHSFLSNKELFHKHIINSENFYRHFLEHSLPALGTILLRFKDAETFVIVSELIDRCLFQRNLVVFTEYFRSVFEEGGVEHDLPKLLLQTLSGSDRRLYKLVFHSFCNSYNKFDLMYKFFVVLLQVLGFEVGRFFSSKLFEERVFDKRVLVMTDLCEILHERNCDFSCRIKETSFADFLEYSLSDVLNSVEPCPDSYEFLNKFIALHPLVVKTRLDEVLGFVLKDKCNAPQREKFLLSLFEVFAKLHRITNLISAMVNTVEKEKAVDSVDVPLGVLTYFTQCVTTMASWQILELYKAFLVQLDEAVINVGNEDNSAYVEFICVLLCQFLMSVRIAEHTVPTTIVESFEKNMIQLKDILRKFGTALVCLEHNPRLMQAYLNLCLKWGDVQITLAYYENTSVETLLDNDYSATNLTYLHSYLTREQWRLISQRIANFGEKRCKQIMQSLCVQKLKAMRLFEKTMIADVVPPVVANILASLDDQNEDLIFNQFVLQNLIIPNCQEGTVRILVKNIVANNGVDRLQQLVQNPNVIGRVLYEFLYRLNKAFGKRNRERTLTSKILKNLTDNLVEVSDLITVKESLKNENDFNCTVNETELNTYLDLMRSVPVAQFENRLVVETVFLYMVALRVDLKKCVLQDSTTLGICENLAIGIAQSLKLSNNVVTPTIIELIVENFEKYDEVFNFCMQSLLREKLFFGDVLGVIVQNLNQDRFMHCAIIFLDYLERFKNSKLPDDLRRYREEICQKLFSFVQTKNERMEKLTEAFAFVLKLYLIKNNEAPSQELLSYVDEYIDMIITSDGHIKGAVLFLLVVIKNKVKCRITDATVIQIWNCIHRLQTNEERHFDKLVALTLQYVPDDHFNLSSSKLLTATETDGFEKHLHLWILISSSNLTSAQTKTWQTTLDLLLYQKIFPRLKLKHDTLPESLVQLQLAFLQNAKLPLSASLLESVLLTVSLVATNDRETFVKRFNLSISLLESLIKNRKTLTVDYLPTYLQRYRTLLNHLCTNSNSDLKLSLDDIEQVSHCAHKFEKLTKSLVSYDRALMRISPNLIADILKQFERLTIYPNVKVHLNNCLYQLLALCDEHSVAYLKRVLSTASTEMFKVVYENYNKYYKFTGKV
ncbi:hypothetical protein RN001_015253 [Aquatica leii]|uniref:Nucleolar 27S pre-rRNA processing Urb2/Npa2 C-terminal domain-containing protein n=1 Tax=Aquatica leii TaxID=1421715 RepID=A0AAN7SCV9_9COLE|nr:hypothetical protein RN001_015253 [Aquatica leii]